MDPLSLAISTGIGLVGALAIEQTKKHTGAWDNKVGKWLKPAQPAILLGLTMAGPWLVSKGVDIGDPATAVNAPISAIAGLVALNFLKKLTHKVN